MTLRAGTNYDVANIHLETDNRPWVLGSTYLGEALLNQAWDTGQPAAWNEVTTDFLNIGFSHSVDVQDGALFNAEAGGLTCTTRKLAYSGRLFSRPIRLRTGASTVEWVGKVSDIKQSQTPDPTKPAVAFVDSQVSITAVDRVASMAQTTLQGFTAPSELASARAARIWPSINATGLPARYMTAITTPVNASVLSLLQDVADVTMGALLMVGEVLTLAPVYAGVGRTWTFPKATGNRYSADLRSLDSGESVTDIVTSLIASTDASQFNPSGTSIGVQTPTQGALVREIDKTVQVDDIPSIGLLGVQEWANAFPLQSTTSMQATGLDAKLDYSVSGAGIPLPQALDAAAITVGGVNYSAAIKGISHSITPQIWRTTVDLMPGYLITGRQSPIPPTPTSLTALATTGIVSLGWFIANGGGPLSTTYVVRRAVGAVAPATPTSGTLISQNIIYLNSVVDSGVTPGTQYSYSLWFVTDDPNVYSLPATITVTAV